ncbi:MAG: hypothetical protein AAF806_27000 [Bacteroidota bacterium]
MLITQLRKDEDLKDFITQSCCENEVCVEIDEAIEEEDYLVVQLDKYYQAKIKSPNTPKSPDCLIVQKCEQEQHRIFVVELKNVQSQSGKYLERAAIREKFETALLDFMSDRFRAYFYDEDNQFRLYLILVAGNVNEEKTKNFRFDFLLSLRPLRFANRLYAIQGKNPNPLVVSC